MAYHGIYTSTLLLTLLLSACGTQESSTPTLVLSDRQEAKYNLSLKIDSLDPRIAQGIGATNLLAMLNEGLIKTDSEGKVLPALAETITISPDMKSYTFTIKISSWSNGDPIMADDFAYGWKSQLDPARKSSHSYMLQAIKGVKEFQKNPQGQNEIGITVINDRTLKVDLEKPTPYFLQMLATQCFYPVQKKWSEKYPEFKIDGQHACIASGPFALISYNMKEGVQLRKNSEYWDQEAVKLTHITCNFSDEIEAYAQFQKNALDWIGNPFAALSNDQIVELKKQQLLTATPAAHTQFIRVNTTKMPFSIPKMRQAFCLALDLEKIVSEVMDGDETVATSFVPKCLGLSKENYFIPHDLDQAKKLYEDALTENALTEQTLPPITLHFVGSDRARKMAEIVKQNIKEAFNLDITLAEQSIQELTGKLITKDYSLAMGGWLAEYFDPMSFLEIFANDTNGVNNTGWTNDAYSKLLTDSRVEMDEQKRFALLEQAEEILMQALPILPLFHLTFTYGKHLDLQGDLLSPLGVIDITTSFRVKQKEKQ